MIQEQSRMRASAEQIPFGRNLTDTLTAASPALRFGLRLWASVCFALLVAFWLELDNPFWAGASAAIVCQPQLGASLRKGWFRMIGTVVGAAFAVVLTSWFPQDRLAYLGLLALWGGLCAFAATALRNFASYGAALAGYTAAIIAATDLGGARQRLATSFADLAAEIAAGFARMLQLAGPRAPDTQSERRELLRRVIALEPSVDQTLGESSHVRSHAVTLQAAIH